MTVPEQDWQEAGARIDALIAASGSGGVVARERAEELVRLVADLYGAGLERLLEIVHDAGALTEHEAVPALVVGPRGTFRLVVAR